MFFFFALDFSGCSGSALDSTNDRKLSENQCARRDFYAVNETGLRGRRYSDEDYWDGVCGAVGTITPRDLIWVRMNKDNNLDYFYDDFFRPARAMSRRA